MDGESERCELKRIVYCPFRAPSFYLAFIRRHLQQSKPLDKSIDKALFAVHALSPIKFPIHTGRCSQMKSCLGNDTEIHSTES